MIFTRKILIFCGVALLCVCGSVSAQKRMTHAEYIEKYKRYALENQESHGIPASITMAQGLLESDCGNSRLAVIANNHFGIKCKSTWTGPSISHDDDAKGECFRQYPSAEASFRDHCDFLDQSSRYAALFELDPLDYKGWARGLKAAGYATNPKYADMLIKLIDDYQLYALDKTDLASLGREVTVVEVDAEELSAVLAEKSTAGKIDVDNYTVVIGGPQDYATFANNGSVFVLAKEGDTYGSLSKKLRISERKLRKYNDSGKTRQPEAGMPVYIKSKASKSVGNKLLHGVTEGESMYSISQKYGIKLNRLARMNRLATDTRLSPGMQIRLM